MISALTEGKPTAEEELKKALNRPKPLTPETRVQGAAKISSQYGNAFKKPKPEPKRREILGRSVVKKSSRKHAVSYANTVKSFRLVTLPKTFPQKIHIQEEHPHGDE